MSSSGLFAYHVPEVGAESACGLVVLHHTIVVQNFSTAVTEREAIRERVNYFIWLL